MWGLSLEAAGRSHPGWVRALNEDAFVCDASAGLFAVIDGMGGHACGEVASAIARKHLRHSQGSLTDRLMAASEEIRSVAAGSPAHRGMGCVATAATLRRGALRLAHVGDTRAYLVSDAGCERLTRDHNRATEAWDQGGTPDGRGDALTADLGKAGLHPVDVDAVEVDVASGDLLVLCSDGLHDRVPGPELMARLRDAWRRAEPTAEVVDRLMALALERGGTDNITIVVVRVVRPRAVWWLGVALLMACLAVAAGQLGRSPTPQFVWDPPEVVPARDTGTALAELPMTEEPR